MHHWQADLLQTAVSASDINVFFDRVTHVAQELGYAYVAYGSRRLFPLRCSKHFVINNYPACWQKAYATNCYVSIDPYVEKALSSRDPVVWEEAGAHGLVDGWGQSILSRGLQGLVTVARPSEPINATELQEKKAALYWLSHITHLGLSRFQELIEAEETNYVVQLSQREKEVLKWTADGKTASDISIILNISDRTVNFHIQSCLRKLDCQNKIAAAVKASLMGLLWG